MVDQLDFEDLGPSNMVQKPVFIASNSFVDISFIRITLPTSSFILLSLCFSFTRCAEVPDQSNHLLLMGGKPGEHQLWCEVQPSGDHAVETRPLHHLQSGDQQHPHSQRRRTVASRGFSTLLTLHITFEFCSNCFAQPWQLTWRRKK